MVKNASLQTDEIELWVVNAQTKSIIEHKAILIKWAVLMDKI